LTEDLQTRRLVTIQQAMGVVGVSRRTIYNWLHAGRLEYRYTAGGTIRIFADTLWRDHPINGAPLPEDA
jgi:excisionase family DNA binding protein